MSVKEQKSNNAEELLFCEPQGSNPVFLSDSPSITTAFEANPTCTHAHLAAVRESSKLGDFQAL